MLSRAQQETLPFERWSALRDDFNSKAGAVRERNITRITWYKDPPNAAPGVYAAADFSSQFENTAVHCGYVVWREQPDGSFLLVREEEGFLEKATEAKLKPEERARARAHLRCRD